MWLVFGPVAVAVFPDVAAIASMAVAMPVNVHAVAR